MRACSTPATSITPPPSTRYSATPPFTGCATPTRCFAAWRALKPGGRFVGEFGGAGNVKTVIAALTTKLAERDIAIADTGPWYFPTETAYAERLEAHGFVVDRIGLYPRPTPLPGPLEDWLDNFAESFLSLVLESERPVLKRQVADIARPTLCDDNGIWTVDYVRLRFAAHRR